MAKDYVRRGQGSKKTSRKQPTRQKKTLPWKAGLLAIVAVGAFVYGLYTLSQDPEPPVTTIESTPAPAKKEHTPIPPLPKEEWQYKNDLPNKEIQVQPRKQEVSEIPYIMQCGAFKTLQQAEERKANIAFQGLVSKIRKKENNSWYRIVLGPYKFKRDAERDKHKLQRAKIEPCEIWKDAQ